VAANIIPHGDRSRDGGENKNPAYAGLNIGDDFPGSCGKRVFVVGRLLWRRGFRGLALLFDFFPFLFLFGQLCPVQRFEFKAHGAPPWHQLRFTKGFNRDAVAD
jgi:hypothetical protein